MNLSFVLLASALALGVVVLALHWQRARRQRAMARLLDAADALEMRLREARARFGDANDPNAPAPVREALRQMLRQRLWLQDHGAGASIAELESIRGSIAQADARIRGALAGVAETDARASR